jgi:hypothetical protein
MKRRKSGAVATITTTREHAERAIGTSRQDPPVQHFIILIPTYVIEKEKKKKLSKFLLTYWNGKQ